MAKNESKGSIAPLGDRVLVVPHVAADEKTKSGIIIPDTAKKEKPMTGTVVATGPGKRGDDNEIIPVAVKAGDTIVFSKYGFDEIELDGKEYYILSESGILAVIRK